MERWSDFWRFTSSSSWRMFAEAFPDGEVTIKTYGNVLTATAFLYGLVREDLATEEVLVCDPEYQVLIVSAPSKPVGRLILLRAKAAGDGCHSHRRERSS
jgi:hypothetical protein